MPTTVLLHLSGEEPVLGETVVSVVWPMHRVNFIEILPSREEEELIGFVRE
jgi:hypothetical protein